MGNKNKPSKPKYFKYINSLESKHETQRLIIERTNENDYESLGILIMNKNINFYYSRPIIYLEDLECAKGYIKNQNENQVCFTIKLKTESNQKIIIGQIGFYFADKKCKEIGVFYFLGENYQKKGYATEAACPLIRHIFEKLTVTEKLKIDFNEKNIGSQKLAKKICDDIMKIHPNYIFGELQPFIDKYTLLNKPPPFFGKVTYYFEGYDIKYKVLYPYNYFNNAKYFELKSL